MLFCGVTRMLKVLLICSTLIAARASVLAENPRELSGERIVGGTLTTIEQWPFIVLTLWDYWGTGHFSQGCGGTVLTSRHIMSAAHCFQQFAGADLSQPQFWRIRAGSTFQSSGGTVLPVSRIVNHPQYNDRTFDSDIAVLTLAGSLPLGSTIAQAFIPSQGWSHPDNAISYAVGWGTTSSGGSSSEQLRQGQVRTVNQQTCIQRYGASSITNAMLCAGLLGVGGVDACQGDSGGPFVLNNVVIGVTSWGRGCALADFPGVYARVSFFTNWIINTVSSS